MLGVVSQLFASKNKIKSRRGNMEIKYEGANHSSSFVIMVEKNPVFTNMDATGAMVLELKRVYIDRLNGEYNLKVLLTSEDIGKMVAEFYRRAIIKNNP
jgi:hypothetical protein